MVCGGTTTPTNHMAKVESPPKDSRGGGEKGKKKKGVCAPLVWERGVAWHYRLSMDISACWQCTLHVYRLVGKQAAYTLGWTWWCACFSSILGAGFAPNTYQTTVQPKRFSLSPSPSAYIGNKLFWTTSTRSLQNTTLCMFSPIVTSEHFCQFDNFKYPTSTHKKYFIHTAQKHQSEKLQTIILG